MPDRDPLLEAYRAVADRVVTTALAAEDRLDEPAPACPGWSARHVVHHLAGLCQDWAALNLDGYASDEWTAAQVDRFDGASITEVVEAWRTALHGFAEVTESPIGATPANWAFGDAVVHEADLYPVLAPGTRVPDDAVGLALRAGVARWRMTLADVGAPPLRIVGTGAREWAYGEIGDDAASVEAPPYEWFRTWFGRRSRSQVEAFEWSTDPTPWLDAGLAFPFRWADTDLTD